MNQKGFVSLSTIIFMPLLLLMLFGFFWSLWFINQKNHINNICYESILESQQRLVDGNEELLSLNTLAYAYIIEKKFWEAVMISAPPQAKPAARAQRRRVIQQQRILAKSQDGILQLAGYASQASLFNLRRKFYGKVERLQEFWKAQSPGFSSIQIFPRDSQVKIQIKDIAPVYERKRDHSNAQSLSARWHISLKSFLPQWLKDIVPVHKNWSGKCKSHPHKGDFQWHSAIGEDKHS